MRAVRLHAFGGPETLVYEEVPKPAPGQGEVLVQVRAVAFNPLDAGFREGFTQVPESLRPVIELPYTPGVDVSGEIAALGDGVTAWRVGDDVLGMAMKARGYAEYAVLPAAVLVGKPESVDHVRAAAVPLVGLTAVQYLDRIDPAAGARVLVNGAAGGVGHVTVQLAKSRGAQVIGVASGRHENFLRDLGVDEFVDYTTTDVTTVSTVDHVIDCVGGPEGYRFLDVVRRGGTISPVYLGDYRPDHAAELGVRLVPGERVRSDSGQLAELARLMADGRLRVAVDSEFPLPDAAKAHERYAHGHLRGKIVLNVG
ncbi:NADPH:quinone reductase-like Zn-dependent oxidoreductase [Herbihabitans rhizosphaerae]|uniref:NADPH:quinone reductase-like Zn-dependent oxidoreductase n=1 Tax=Herbihabitans rhizosphaerae TaxID=1872711 RepID=A0A4V2ERU3_9PSEU|nr:NADP-dependent oxidoreductase [Herbihabitans rhizosphaerae]RZS34067.1 NADPH:quinone reductase-like Zn-dependent oxidoreductase [Herbihabitans rhizosphaerae]